MKLKNLIILTTMIMSSLILPAYADETETYGPAAEIIQQSDPASEEILSDSEISTEDINDEDEEYEEETSLSEEELAYEEELQSIDAEMESINEENEKHFNEFVEHENITENGFSEKAIVPTEYTDVTIKLNDIGKSEMERNPLPINIDLFYSVTFENPEDAFNDMEEDNSYKLYQVSLSADDNYETIINLPNGTYSAATRISSDIYSRYHYSYDGFDGSENSAISFSVPETTELVLNIDDTNFDENGKYAIKETKSSNKEFYEKVMSGEIKESVKQESLAQMESESKAEQEAVEAEKTRKRTNIISIIVISILTLGLLGGGYWLYRKIHEDDY